MCSKCLNSAHFACCTAEVAQPDHPAAPCAAAAGKTRIANALYKGGLESLNHSVLLVGPPLADLALNSVQGDLPPLQC